MDFGLQDRVVLVTGASAGIGRATALAFAAEGARVAVGYHRDDAAAAEVVDLVAAGGGEAVAVALDLADDGAIDAGVAAAADRWGALHVVVNNAGFMPTPGPFETHTDGVWSTAVRAHLEGPGRVIQAAVPALKAAGWGRIVSVSTIHADTGAPMVAAYTAAKAGLHGLTRSLSRELAPAGTLVNLVMPALTETEKVRERFPPERVRASAERSPTGRNSTPEDVARLIVFLGSAANGHVNGELIRVTGGL
jgi:NAD(P)-dependent dehydrogenase (short-subunit alcohol dehydrogenase family)